nr:uncharacterized protein LOC112019900 [Quercus suber]
MAENQGEDISRQDDQAENHGIDTGIQQNCLKDKGVQDVNDVNSIPNIMDKVANNSNSNSTTLLDSHNDGQRGPKLPKPKATWTRIMRMDYGLGDIIRAAEGPLLGKRGNTHKFKNPILNTEEDVQTERKHEKIDECLNTVPHRVTPDMQQLLSSEFTIDEIKGTVFQMGPTKVGDSVIAVVLDYLNSGVMIPEINHTNILPIPKVKSPEKMSNFWPISLHNVIYKIISNVLANKLKQILPNIISSTQSAFVPGRLIIDNVLVAYEILHTMHSRKKGKKGLLTLKLDISKAYDMVE